MVASGGQSKDGERLGSTDVIRKVYVQNSIVIENFREVIERKGESFLL